MANYRESETTPAATAPAARRAGPTERRRTPAATEAAAQPAPQRSGQDVADDNAADNGAHGGSAGAAVPACVSALRRADIRVGHLLRLRSQHGRAVGVGDGLVQVDGLGVLGCLKLAHRLREPGTRLRPDAAAPGVDVVGYASDP